MSRIPFVERRSRSVRGQLSCCLPIRSGQGKFMPGRGISKKNFPLLWRLSFCRRMMLLNLARMLPNSARRLQQGISCLSLSTMNSHSHQFSSPTQRLNLLSFNSNSLFNKIDELLSLIKSFPSPPVFICICETWCRPSEPESLYNLPQYQLFCRDRRECSGGVAVYVY